MTTMRRPEKEITDPIELHAILQQVKYITIAMCVANEPYLVTLSHGFDTAKNALYFHCAQEGKKIGVLSENNIVWGQAMVDHGYVYGRCSHRFTTVQFRGRVTFIHDAVEKRHALATMIRQLETDAEKVMAVQVTDASVAKVKIGRIDIDLISGKKSMQ